MQEVEIGPFSVDLATCQLLRDGVELGLRPQAFRALKALIQNRGQYVDYERMIAEAWDGTVVSKHTVDVTVGEVRKALQEFGPWIIHRPKVGYRLDVPRSEDLIRKGWHFWKRCTREGFEKALACFRQAAQDDAADFRAYEGLATCYLTLGSHGMRPPREMYELFLDMHSRAVALSGLTPELRTLRAHGLHMVERKFAEAEAELLKAQREKPTLTRAYVCLSMVYVAAGRFNDALEILVQGAKADPLWPLLPAAEVSVRFFRREFSLAVECGIKAVELQPYIQLGRAFYAQALEYSGRVEEALAEYERAFMMSPDLLWLRPLEATCLARNGRQREAYKILGEIEKIRATDYVDAYHIALLYDALGQRDLAFQELERAREENSINLCLLDVDPKLDSLRRDPRFERLRGNLFGPIDGRHSMRSHA
jgi:tetratricopeptide (TPR) repeat protein